MSKQFFEASVAIWHIFNRVGLKLTFFELIPAVGANKALWMEFLSHGSYDASTNSLPTNVTIMDFPIV